MILVIDNFDSFVHNLARYIERLGVETQVVRNDAITSQQIAQLAPQAIVLSPGPCTPDEAGCSLQVVRDHYRTTPMLGVCLGHQAIAQSLGGKVVRSGLPWHGRKSTITHHGQGVFAGLPASFDVGRYHSLEVKTETLPNGLRATAWNAEGVVMAIQHTSLPVVGLQFHPESILTEHGYAMLSNFLQLAGIDCEAHVEPIQASELQIPLAKYRLPDRPVTF